MSRQFRVSVSFPFSQIRMWASGSPSKIRIDDLVQEYAAPDVAQVVASLQRAVSTDAVITVY